MLDIGWPELFVIAVVAILVIGPKDLPRTMAQVARWLRKARSMAREFQSGIDDMVREAELDDIRRQVEATSDLDLARDIEDALDPGGEVAKSLDMREIERDIDDASKPELTDKSAGKPQASEAKTEVDQPATDGSVPVASAESPATSEEKAAKPAAKGAARTPRAKTGAKARSAPASGGTKKAPAKSRAPAAKPSGGRPKKTAAGSSGKAGTRARSTTPDATGPSPKKTSG